MDMKKSLLLTASVVCMLGSDLAMARNADRRNDRREDNRGGRNDRQDRRDDNRGGRNDRQDRRNDNRGGRDDVRVRREVVVRETRREVVRRQRQTRVVEIRQRREVVTKVRTTWKTKYRVNVVRNVVVIRNPNTWRTRYNTWVVVAPRPVFVVYPVRWNRPMPVIGSWNYTNIENVADNVEFLTRDIYMTMAEVTPPTPYGLRLQDALANLADAAENFNDSVSDTYDWSDSLYDLFHLESALNQAEGTLSGYSQAGRVGNEMAALRMYVNQLLWTYRQNY